MGWLRSHGIIRVGGRGITGYYIRDDWQSMILKVDNSGYSDWFVSEDCEIKFKVTSQETGDMEMQTNGDIAGYPYYSGNYWNLWYTGTNTWILANRSEGPDLGEPPVPSYQWNNSLSVYEYDGDEYYTGSFNYTCLNGTAGTFTHNLSGTTITLSAVWPSNFVKRTSGHLSSIVGEYGNYNVGFLQWKATVDNQDMFIHKINRRTYGHLHSFSSQSAEWNLHTALNGFYHDELGVPNLDSVRGFYFHVGSSSVPEVGSDYVFRWCHYVPDEPQQGEEESTSGNIVFDSSTHPDITFEYQERVFETDVEDDNKGLIYMTDASCWR